jgi:hypothetical protein
MKSANHDAMMMNSCVMPKAPIWVTLAICRTLGIENPSQLIGSDLDEICGQKKLFTGWPNSQWVIN